MTEVMAAVAAAVLVATQVMAAMVVRLVTMALLERPVVEQVEAALVAQMYAQLVIVRLEVVVVVV